MFGVIFSVTLSVTIASLLFLLLKGKLINRYGFRIIYTMSLIMAIRLIIPYSIQLPDTPKLNITLPWYLPLIWITGVVVCAAYQTGKYIYMKRKIISYSRSVSDESVLKQYEAVKSGLFIDNDIPLIVSAKVSSPMLLGIIKPCIVLPRHMFSDEETEMVLRHELMHYKSKDSFKKLFFAVVAVLQWFNPFIWLLMKEVCRSLECICDEKVTKNADSQYKKNYCYMLLKTGAQNQTPTAIVNYFSTKEMLKMRITNVFESKRKKPGTVLITTFTMCIAVLSGFLCSCTVKTPSDVKEEMSRVEQGIENEKDATETSTESASEAKKLMSVSEVVSTAQQTIDEWNSKNGIFKFDNCNVIIPQVSEFAEYTAQFEAGIETPQKKYEQYKRMEKEVFGENFFNENELKIYPGTYLGVESISLEEYLESDNGIGIIANRKDGGGIENQISVLSYVLPYHDEMYRKNINLVKTYNCYNCTEAELNEEWELIDGRMTVAEIIKLAEETIEKLNGKADSKMNFTVSQINVYGNDSDNLHSVEIFLQTFCGDIPMIELYQNFDDSDEIKYKGMLLGQSEMYMCKFGEISQMHTNGTNFALSPTGNSTNEIISLEQVLELIKKKLSNSVVYDVESIQLGYSGNAMTDDDYWNNNKTIPAYNVVLRSTTNKILFTIDAVKGDMNVETRIRKG